MISLPLVYTILALLAYSTSFCYVVAHFMEKSEPNLWVVGFSVLLGLMLHASVLYHDMLTPMAFIMMCLMWCLLPQDSCCY